LSAPDCLTSWHNETGSVFDYVYITKDPPRQGLLFEDQDCCPGLRLGLASDANYVKVYDGPGATIFKVVVKNAALPPK
jgi:hypothetical protein